jgi:hypothetical protein
MYIMRREKEPQNMTEQKHPVVTKEPDLDRTQESRRINVELVGQAAEALERLTESRQLSVSQAVRQALSLLAEFDPREYDLILRRKDGSGPDERLKLVG